MRTVILISALVLAASVAADPLKMMMDIDSAASTYNHVASEQLAQRLMVHRHPRELEQQHNHHVVAHAKSYRQLVAIVLAAHLGGLTYWAVLFVKRRPGPDNHKLRQPPKRVSCEFNM